MKNTIPEFIIKRNIINLANDLGRIGINLDSDVLSELIKTLLDSSLEENYTNFGKAYYSNDFDQMQNFLKSHGINSIIKKEIRKKIDLESISEFDNEGTKYIKITLSDGTNKILENSSNYSADELFNLMVERLGNKEDLTAADIFNDLEKVFVDVKLQDSDSVKTELLNEEEEVKLNFVKSNFPTSIVEASIESNIYVVKTEGEEDYMVRIEEKDGIYQLYYIEEQKNVENSNGDFETTQFQSDEQLDHIIDEYITDGYSPEDILDLINSRDEKFNYNNDALLEIISNRHHEKTKDLAPQKQYVLMMDSREGNAA